MIKRERWGNQMKSNYNKFFSLMLIFSFTIFTLRVGAVAVAPDLGTASEYGILATTATVTEQTNVAGSLGSGEVLGDVVVSGSIDEANDAYTKAFTDFGEAITTADSLEADSSTDANLGGKTLTPGIYEFTDAITIGSDMTLEGNGVYIFKTVGALTTAEGTEIRLSGGAEACNIFWVAEEATIGADSTFKGTLMSRSAISVGANSVTDGRILAKTAVTADAANTRIIVPAACAALPTGDLCKSPSISVLLDPEGNMVIHAVLPNDQKATGTWNFDLGGNIYTVKGSEDVTYTAKNAPVGTYVLGAQFIEDDNGEIVDLESCAVSVATVTGGQTPDTATPWYNLLLVGVVLSIMGIIGTGLWKRRNIYE